MKKRALLVGINYPKTPHQLRGCVNDVRIINELITRNFGFTQVKDKRMLTDNSATTQNILERLEWLVDGAEPGDVLLFHYSGHGSQMIDTNYDNDIEPDGKDEVIVPIDMNWRDKVIKDDDLKRIFDTVPDGVNLTVILDCCHSGSGIDSIDTYQPLGESKPDFDPFSPNKNRLLPMPADIENRAFGIDVPRKQRTVTSQNKGGLLISGCQSHQTSADTFIANKYCGAATFFLSRVVQQFSYDLSYEALVRFTNVQLEHWNYSQRPELNGDKSLFSKRFLKPFV